MCECSAGPAVRQTRPHLDMVDEITKQARQLHALLLALTGEHGINTSLPTGAVADGMWLAMDLAAAIFERASGFPLLDPNVPQEEARHGTH